MEIRNKIVRDLRSVRDAMVCPETEGECESCADIINAAIYELEHSGYPSDGVWYIEKRGSSARLILKPDEIADIKTLAVLESKRESVLDECRNLVGSFSIDDLVSAVFKALAKE